MPPRPLKIAVCQLNYKLCDFARNVALIEGAVRQASDAELIVFSELCLSGYHPLDLVEAPDFLQRQKHGLDAVLRLSAQVEGAIVIGLVTPNSTPGKPLHNSLLVIQHGRIMLTYDKQLLPTYDVFDERRYFEPGPQSAAVLEMGGHRIGFLICEDGWNDDVRLYALNPIKAVVEQDVDLIVNINASPSHLGKRRQRHEIFGAVAKRYGIALLYSNQVGGNDQLVYDGASFALDRTGTVVHELPPYKSAVETILFDGDFHPESRESHARLAGDLPETEFFYRQAQMGLRDYMEKVGFKSVIVGSSGGIDSALTLALACDAIGPEAVHAVTMPSRHSSTGSVSDSLLLAERLGISLVTHEIAAIVERYESRFAECFGTALAGVAAENLQARVRGTVLMEASNQFGHLVLSTGNKSEMSVGYATLYGDMNGGLNLIGDLYKTEVFALARHMNELHGSQIIPESILRKEPSAELAPGQKDRDSLPPYEILDAILKHQIEGTRLSLAESSRVSAVIRQLMADDNGELIRKVCTLVARAEFKRRQAPPIIRMRERAFGIGRQMPIAATYCY